jgi:hypothetical protein
MKHRFILLFLLLAKIIFAQKIYHSDKLQYGASLKASFFINNIKAGIDSKKNEPPVSFKLSGNVGIGKSWLNENIYPTFNTEFQLYYSGLGSNSLPKTKREQVLDVILAFTLTAGKEGNDDYYSLTPLRYFSDFAYPALKNPYQYSFSVGTNIIFSTDKNRETQRVGFLNGNAYGFQLSYYNDGTPFPKALGDGEDRYYTGGGTLSFDKHIGNSNYENQMINFELSYHRFTGFNKHAFDLSSIIGNSLVDYGKDTDQMSYNKNVWRFNSSLRRNDVVVGLSLASNNTKKYDGQSFIHLLISDDSYHFLPYKKYFSIEPNVTLLNQHTK